MMIDEYFAAVERHLRRYPHTTQITAPFECLTSDDYNGLLRCRVVFWDDSFLDIYEVVSTELGYPVRIHYAYTYLRAGQHIFRYDNAPHYPEIMTHPHHKHIGITERVAPAEQPTLHQILAEVETWL